LYAITTKSIYNKINSNTIIELTILIAVNQTTIKTIDNPILINLTKTKEITD
jgi:hypothetical protein